MCVFLKFTSCHATLWRNGLYAPATPPRSLTPLLCSRTAVERHMTRVSHAPGQTNSAQIYRRITTGRLMDQYCFARYRLSYVSIVCRRL